MLDRYTDKARKVIVIAQQQARLYNCEYIDTEHLLFGVVDCGHGVALNVLQELGVDSETVKEEIKKVSKKGAAPVAFYKLPQTPDAKAVHEQAAIEAQNLFHNYIGTDHLLLGLIHNPNITSAHILNELGLEADTIKTKLLEILGQS